jgi:hypothetical protein
MELHAPSDVSMLPWVPAPIASHAMQPSPRIESVSWGRTVVDGLGEVKDVKLWPGGGRAWDWNETGTRHAPGIQPADVQELLDNGAEVVVLSRGMQLRLQTCPETLALLSDRVVDVHIEETTAAVTLYNELARTGPVGCLIHSTC